MAILLIKSKRDNIALQFVLETLLLFIIFTKGAFAKFC